MSNFELPVCTATHVDTNSVVIARQSIGVHKCYQTAVRSRCAEAESLASPATSRNRAAPHNYTR